MTGKRVRVRAAPSPTGFIHVGNLRTFIYDEFLAKQSGGDFVLRIEDTDQERFVPGAVEKLILTLKRMGIEPNEGVWLAEDDKTIIQRGDHGPYIQSERKSRHQEVAKDLLAKDKAYYCFCTEERLAEMRQLQETMHQPTGYDGHCRRIDKAEAEKRVAAGEEHVVRLKMPKEGVAIINDIIRGTVKFDWKLVDDQVIVKKDGMATYHLAAMVDDHDMEITHILRGEEWLSSAPKHVFIFESMGWEPPQFAHVPLILNPDRSKLSKRQGDVFAEQYLDKGYLPEALINFLSLLGYNPKDDQEIYTREELTQLFDLSKVNKGGAIFNIEKLNWLNNHYLRQLPSENFFELALPHIPENPDSEFKKRAAWLFRERLVLPAELTELTKFLFLEKLDYTNVKLTWKDRSKEEAVERLKTARGWIQEMDDQAATDLATVEKTIKDKIVAAGWGNGDTLWPLRVSLSAQEKSPSPFELIIAYGKDRSLARIDEAMAYLLK